MKRRIIVLSVLVLSLFTLTQPNTVASSHSGCNWCYIQADLCYQACDQGSLGGRAACYNDCMWQQEGCTQAYCY
jgi:hypothetical protein